MYQRLNYSTNLNFLFIQMLHHFLQCPHIQLLSCIAYTRLQGVSVNTQPEQSVKKVLIVEIIVEQV